MKRDREFGWYRYKHLIIRIHRGTWVVEYPSGQRCLGDTFSTVGQARKAIDAHKLALADRR